MSRVSKGTDLFKLPCLTRTHVQGIYLLEFVPLPYEMHYETVDVQCAKVLVAHVQLHTEILLFNALVKPS